MQQEATFGSVLEAADALSLEEKETLIDVLSHRMAESNRLAIIADMREDERDFLLGRCQRVSVDELVKATL